MNTQEKEQFLSEIRNGTKAGNMTTTQGMQRTRRLTKKMSFLAVLLIAGAIVATAAILPYLMQSTTNVSVTQKDIQFQTSLDSGITWSAWTDMPADFTADVSIHVDGGPNQKEIYFQVRNGEVVDYTIDLSGISVTPDDNALTATVMDGSNNPIDELLIPGGSEGVVFTILIVADSWAETMDYVVALEIPTPV